MKKELLTKDTSFKEKSEQWEKDVKELKKKLVEAKADYLKKAGTVPKAEHLAYLLIFNLYSFLYEPIFSIVKRWVNEKLAEGKSSNEKEKMYNEKEKQWKALLKDESNGLFSKAWWNKNFFDLTSGVY